MNVSERGIDFIKQWEKLALHPYKDIGGVWTWGYGHAQKHGEPVPGSITEDEANSILEEDLTDAVRGVNSIIPEDTNQNKFDALTSLLFNVGIGNIKQPPHHTLDAIQQGDWDQVANLLPGWCHDSGKVSKGLYNRRMAERELLLEEV